ncbi:hypothetical protein [Parabacteroides pacaensis]|uniref:hypothetical protein n=1 Tax=Parabacteroides pacaensis TaxID=2086575 RepID=UPI000D0E5F7B|nr:hypothetical protein [Parabacteroides pacaensis]
MKKVKFSTTLVGLGALALALSLNFIYASNDYGISDNSLSVQVLAQTNKSGGDSGGSGGSGTNTGTGTDENGVDTKLEKQIKKVTVSCDQIIHTETVQPGVETICLGEGIIECKPGFEPKGKSTTTVTGRCPGRNLCKVRQ